MNPPIKFACPSCKNKLKADAANQGMASTCSTCHSELKIPYLGIGRAAYFGWKLLKFTVLSLIAGAAPALFIILIIPSIAVSLLLAKERGINMGLTPLKAILIGLIPGSFIYFVSMKEGYISKAAIPKE